MATRKTLSVQERLQVLEDLETLKVSAAAKKFNVAESTIRLIRRNAPQILKFKDEDVKQKKRQRIRKPVYEELEKQLLAWFIEKRTAGDSMSDKLLLEKASEIKDSIPSCSNFTVSKGWLAKFKNRNNIRLVHAYREGASTNEDDAKRFVEELRTLMKEEQIDENNIYNMDETGLYWKGLPNKTLIGEHEKFVKGWKSRKERVTLVLCANATGTHKLMPLVINKFTSPTALKNQHHSLPAVFKSQNNVWMTQSLFADWYENYFIPNVHAHQAQSDSKGKVILLLDNCSSHKLPESVVNREGFKIILLPANATSLIQPMSQGIIAKIKILYRHRLMQTAATYSTGINQFLKNYNLKNCTDTLYDIWGQISTEDIRNAWNKLIPQEGNVLHFDMQRAMSAIMDVECSESDVIDFISHCDQAESEGNHEGEYLEKVEVKEEKEEEEAEEEGEEGEEEGKIEERGGEESTFNDHEITELKYLLTRLNSYVSRRGNFAQDVFQAIKNDLLGPQQ